ncbi:MAG: hypothetical protein ACKO5Q_18945, partial [Microcystaceae cyanobacterium]
SSMGRQIVLSPAIPLAFLDDITLCPPHLFSFILPRTQTIAESEILKKEEQRSPSSQRLTEKKS